MFILDSLSLTRAATTNTQQKILKTTKSASVVEKSQEIGVTNLIALKQTPTTTITSKSCEMTTNKYILMQQQQQQQQQQHPEPQLQNQVVEKFMIQKMPSPSPHNVKEMIKNSNENLNDELTVAPIVNNTTIGDNTMPQEEGEKEEEQQQQNVNNQNENQKQSHNSTALMEWGNVPATYNCYHNRNNCNDHQTTNMNASITTAANTIVKTTTTATTTTFKALNNDYDADNNARRVAEIMLTNIQNNVDLNTFALKPESKQEAAATTTTTTPSSSSPSSVLQNLNCCASGNYYCCSCSSFGICMRDMASSEGISIPLNKSEYSCNTHSDSNGVSATYDDDDGGSGGGSFYHNSNNNKNNNNNSSASSNNNIVLNTNSLLTVQCAPLTCENEREQETPNGYKHTGNVAATAGAAADIAAATTTIFNNNSLAEFFSTGEREQELVSACTNRERIGDPFGNVSSLLASPVDSVLENFEKFLNSVKLENLNLNQSVAECQDLIDFTTEPTAWLLDCSKANVVYDNDCNKSELVHSVPNHATQTYADDKVHVNIIANQKQCNFENLLYCDLNETLEEQNLLESKEILEQTTAELTHTETATNIMKTFTKVNERHDDDNDDNIVMVDEVNKTTAKTPVTCINVYSNPYNNSNNNNENCKNYSQERHKTCAVVLVQQQTESCQNPNSCSSARTVTATTTEFRVPLENIITSKNCSSSSIENISPTPPPPPTQNDENVTEKAHNLNHTAKTKNIAAANTEPVTNTISCSNTNTQPQKVFAEYKSNCYHSQFQQQQQQEKVKEQEQRIRDQFTSAYTLRDFAKCLKPSADEDIIYTLNFNFTQNNKNENEKENENLQKITYNLNSNESEAINQIKSIENYYFNSESKEVNNFKESNHKVDFNENNLYNKKLKAENVLKPDIRGINYSPSDDKHVTNSNKSELNCKKSLIKPTIKKLKDTQFLELENPTTDKFLNLINQPNAQKLDVNESQQGGVLKELQKFQKSSENSENIGNLENELKFDCNEKIYTREKNSQPLLYLTFVWPTKNEGQVVTTRRQGNDDQGENEIEKSKQEQTEKEYRNNNNNNKINIRNVQDKCVCKCEFATSELEKTYGTCNKNHVEGTSHKGQQQLKTEQKETLEQDNPKYENTERNLYETNLKNKSKCESKTNDFTQVQKIPENVEKLKKNLTSVFSTQQNETKNLTNKKIKEIEKSSIKSVKEEENVIFSHEKISQTSEENTINNKQVCLKENEYNCVRENKSLTLNIKPNNPNKNKTESIAYNQDNGKNIVLNLNKSLKRLNETPNQNINTNQQLLIQQQQQQLEYHYHNCELIEKEEGSALEDQLNLEEFQASQRLKRLLQQQQQFRTRYDTIPPPTTTTTTTADNYKQTNITTTRTRTTVAAATATESLKTKKAILKDDLLLISNNNNSNNNKLEEKKGEETITSTKPLTKANKLQADCEITLERSSLLRETNECKQQSVIEINQNRKEQKDFTNSYTNQQKQVGVEEEEEVVKHTEEQVIEIGLINHKARRQNENVNENKRNSPQQEYVSKKIVRLSQQQFKQIHQQTQLSSILLQKLELTEKQQKQHQQQQGRQQQLENIDIEKLANLTFPKTEISQNPSSPSKLCNLNLQHIVKTKQLLQKQEELDLTQKNLIKSCTTPTPPPAPPSTSTSPSHPLQFDEYKSAFVSTKPEIYKYIKSLTGTTKNLITTTRAPVAVIPLIPLTAATANASLSEFDTQRFSDFFYLNHLNTSLNSNNNNNNNNNNSNNTNCQITHGLKTQQQLEQHEQELLLQQYQQYPLYDTTNFVDSIYQIPFCYDELLVNEIQQQQQLKQHETLNATTTTTNSTNNGDTETDDDLISISSNNSSPCDCINCQQQQNEQEIQLEQNRDRDRERGRDNTNVVVIKPTEDVKLQKQQTSYKMREVNGQLRGLLKKPNRPPPARKNRVVFDETRNEFFEADYIILIREDCAYDEEDEEPCTCGEHELVRLCCEEGCQCNYSTSAPATTTDDNRTPQSPKYAPPIEFVDEAALSPPDGYKDNGLKNTLGGALSGHIFGAQHLQQLQVIQRLQQQRAAMLAARNNTQIPPPPPPATAAASVNQQSATACSTSSPLSSSSTPSATGAAVATTAAVSNNGMMNQTATMNPQQHSPDDDTQGVCTECAECAECAAKQSQQDAECNSPQCQEDLTAPLGVPAVALLPIHTSSPERRMTQKEIIAGEERPRYVLQAQYKSSPVSERRIVREATEDLAVNAISSPAITTAAISSSASTAAVSAGGCGDSNLLPPALPAKPGTAAAGAASINNDLSDSEKPPPIPPKESSSPTTQISGILKGGKLWKQDSISQQSDDQNNTTSEDEAGSTSNGTTKRSVRFVTEEISNDEVDGQLLNVDEDNQINELIPIRKHSTLFKNALRPNSAVQQLFPSTVSHQTLTSEALRAFDESKRAGCLVSTLPGSAGDSDTLRRSMERNILRRSLIKKKAVKSDISLEDRIKQLTCGIDEDNDESTQENGDDDNSKIEDSSDLSHRDSPAGEENPQKFNMNGNNSDKSFSPNSSVSSSSSGSSAYKKITEIFNREKKNQEKIMEMEENPIVIIPQECRCPAAPDLGMGIQVPVVHTQIHRTPPRQTEPKRQFLSTLAPLTACVAGNKDDLSSYYTLAAAHHSHASQNAHAAEYNLAAMMASEHHNNVGVSQSTGDEVRKVAPDVIAGTPGQEQQQDELAAFAQQEANRTDKIKKRYSNEPTNAKETNKEINSDDDEGNDYGFNKRPSVRGIKPKFSSTNEILQQMQDQLSQQMPTVAHSQPLPQPMKSYTLPKQSSASAITKQLTQQQQQQQQQPSPQNVPHQTVATSQQQLPQQQQLCSAVAPPATTMQIPTNAAIAQQQTEQRTWSFYSETGGAGAAEQQRVPVENAAAAMQQSYYQTLPAGAMFRHTMIHQHQQHGPEEAMLYAQNCHAMATTIEPQPHYGHYARSPTRRPESPPPLRNYHQTMVLIPYNAETYSQFAATNMDPKVAHIQRQNILEYQQVTQQTIRVPIGYALPGMQLHVVAGRGHAAQYATAASAAQTHHHQHQRIMTQRYQFAQEASMAGFCERGVPEGAAAVSHSDCTAASGMVSPTTGQQIAIQQQQQGAQLVQQQQQQQVNCQQQQINCQQQQQQQQQAQPQTQNNMQSAAQGSVYYAMNV